MTCVTNSPQESVRITLFDAPLKVCHSYPEVGQLQSQPSSVHGLVRLERGQSSTGQQVGQFEVSGGNTADNFTCYSQLVQVEDLVWIFVCINC